MSEPKAVLKMLTPAGEKLVAGETDLYIYPQKYKRHIGEPVYIGDGDRLLGVAALGEPESIREDQLETVEKRMGMEAGEARERWPMTKLFWLYPVTKAEKLETPVEYVATDDGVSWVEEPVLRKKAAPPPEKLPGFGLTEGDTGTAVVQTHETGPAERLSQADTAGWEVETLDVTKLDNLSYLTGKSYDTVAAAYAGARQGASAVLKAMIAAVDTQNLDPTDIEFLAEALPIDVHTDIRMVAKGRDYWVGGELATPDSQYSESGLKRDVTRVLADFSTPDGSLAMGDPAWLEVGVEKALTVAEGDDASRYRVRDQFTWTAGVQAEDSMEFMFEGETLNGRYVMKRAETGGWLFTKPTDQTFESLALQPMEDVVWNAEIIKRIDEQRTVVGVVLKPGTTDAQGDIIRTPEVIEAAAELFLTNLIAGKAKMGVQHNDFSREIVVVQSFIAPAPITVNDMLVPEGAWVMKVRVVDEETWQKIKRGEIRGFSIGGKARVRRLAA